MALGRGHGRERGHERDAQAPQLEGVYVSGPDDAANVPADDRGREAVSLSPVRRRAYAAGAGAAGTPAGGP